MIANSFTVTHHIIISRQVIIKLQRLNTRLVDHVHTVTATRIIHGIFQSEQTAADTGQAAPRQETVGVRQREEVIILGLLLRAAQLASWQAGHSQSRDPLSEIFLQLGDQPTLIRPQQSRQKQVAMFLHPTG